MAVAAEAKLDDCNDKDGLEEQSYVISNANILHQVIAERKEQENKYSLVWHLRILLRIQIKSHQFQQME